MNNLEKINEAIQNNEPHKNLVKFECFDCGCYYWVRDRNDFVCHNCEDKEKGV